MNARYTKYGIRTENDRAAFAAPLSELNIYSMVCCVSHSPGTSETECLKNFTVSLPFVYRLFTETCPF